MSCRGRFARLLPGLLPGLLLGILPACSAAHRVSTSSGRGAAPAFAARAVLTVHLGHSDQVRGATELADGRILSWSEDGTLRLWCPNTWRVLAIMEGHEEEIEGVEILSDGRILSWSADGTLRTWDGATGQAIAVWAGGEGAVRGVSALPDGRILSWSKDGSIRIRDAVTGEPVAVLRGHTRDVSTVDVRPDGRLLSRSWDGSIRLWDADTGAELSVLRGDSEGLQGTAEFADGRLLSWSADGQVRTWELATGRMTSSFSVGSRRKKIHDVLALPDGRVLTAHHDGTLRIWDSDSGKQLRVLGEPERLHVDDEGRVRRPGTMDARVLADGRILSWSSNGDLALWDGTTDQPLAVMDGHDGAVMDPLVLADGRILSWSEDGTLRLWDGVTGRALAVLEGHGEIVTGATVLDDGRILSMARGGTLRLWDGATGRALAVMEGKWWVVGGATLIGDGRILAWGSRDLCVWDGEDGERIAVLGHEAAGPRHVARLPGKRLLSVSWDGALRLRDGTTGRHLGDLGWHLPRLIGDPMPSTLADGRVLAWENASVLRFWDGSTERPPPRFTGTLRLLDGNAARTSTVAPAVPGRVLGARFLPDDRLLSWSEDHVLRIWDETSGQLLGDLVGHTDEVVGALPLSDQRLLSWSEDGTARLWNPTSGECIAVMEEGWRGAKRVSPLEDGRYLIKSSIRHRIWNGRPDAVPERVDVTAGRSNIGESILPGGRILSWSWDGPLWIHDVNGGDTLVLQGHTAYVMGATGLTGDRILSWSADGTLRVWDAVTGETRAVMRGHLGGVLGAEALDEGILVSWSFDGTLRYWNLDTGELLATTLSTETGEWAVVTPDGRFDAPGGFRGMHFVVDHREVIELDQLWERFYEPNLLAKVLGYSDEPLRDIDGLDEVELWPDVEIRGGGARLAVQLTNRGGGLGKVTVRLNGTEVLADARMTRGNRVAKDAAAATLEIDLADHPKLRPGEENRIEVIAYNGDESIASRGANRVFVASGVAADDRPDLHAVVAGVSDYEGDQIDLSYAAKDAGDFAAALGLAAVPGELFEEVEIQVLSTGEGDRSPTRANLARAIGDLRGTDPSDVVVIFLAGHGVQDPSAEDSYLFLTRDAASTAGLADTALQERWTVSSQQLHEWLKEVPAGKIVLILDTCAAEAAAESLSKPRNLSGSQIRAIDRLKRASGVHILMGSAADSVSYEASRYGQGLLTYSLLEGMRGGGLAEQGLVDVRTLFDHAQQRVGELARGIGGVQEPVVAAPRGQTFAIGQLDEQRRRQIPLQLARPMISAPSFLRYPEGVDDLDLGDRLVEALVERQYGAARGAEEVVFVDARDVAGGCAPSGFYRVDEGAVVLDLRLVRDGSTVFTGEVAGRETELESLVAQLVEAVVGACSPD